MGEQRAHKKAPLPLEEEEEEQNELGMKVNESFAQEYHERKRRQELAKAREEGLLDADEEDSSTSEEEDEGEIPATTNAKVMGIIEMIRNKDPQVYDSSKNFFREDELIDNKGANENETPQQKKAKKLTARDVVRQQILEAGKEGRHDAFQSDDEDDEENEQLHGQKNALSGKVYDEEQAELRKEFLKQASAAIDKNDGANEDGDSMLKKKEKRGSSNDPYSLLTSSSDHILEELGSQGKQAALRFLNEQPEDEKEAFLHNFIVQQKWKTTEQQTDSDMIEKLIEEVEEDEQEVDKADQYEAKLNFRFEEQEGDQIKSFARDVPGSMRREEPKRAKQRENKKLRKQQKEQEEKERLRQVKAMKEVELRKYLRQMLEMAGSSMSEDQLLDKLKQHGIDLDGDFDSSKWDKAMEAIFDESYYNEGDEELELEEAGEDDDDTADKARERAGIDTGSHGEEQQGAMGGEAEELLEQAKQAHKQLIETSEYEVSGPKFKYREVQPNSWGLTATDILAAREEDLNQFVSLKKLAPYRDNEWNVPSKLKKTKINQLRSKLEKLQQQEEHAAEEKKKQIRKEKRERKKQKKQGDDEAPKSDTTSQRQPRRKNREATSHGGTKEKRPNTIDLPTGVAVKKSRLASYNVNLKGSNK